ncbi:MAG: DUF4252 domain-containing protein [Polaribacter sp.]
MKQFTLILAFLLTLGATAQETTFKKFYNIHKDKSAFSLNLSASFAGAFLSDDDNDEIKKILKKSGDFKLMVFENEDSEVSKDFKRYVRKYKLTTLMRVKESDGNAEFFILEKNDRVKEIILRASDDNEKLVLFGLKTDMTKEELAEIFSDSNIKITK